MSRIYLYNRSDKQSQQYDEQPDDTGRASKVFYTFFPAGQGQANDKYDESYDDECHNKMKTGLKISF
jgi:hypothetical protein